MLIDTKKLFITMMDYCFDIIVLACLPSYIQFDIPWMEWTIYTYEWMEL